MTIDTDNRSSENASRPARKPYRKPDLVAWGTLQDVTASVGFLSKATDGGKSFAKRTS
jgi:hypothetical protein